jgi:hypothetical protein
MNPFVKYIRDAARGIDGVWVRRYSDGTIFVGITWKSVGDPDHARERVNRLRKLCADLGFECSACGARGTAGEYSFLVADTGRVDLTARTNAEQPRKPKPTGFRVRYRFGPRRRWRFFTVGSGRHTSHARYGTRGEAEAAMNGWSRLPGEEREIVE